MRRGSPTLDTSELLHMLPSAKHVDSMRAKASARARILSAPPHTLKPPQASQPNPFRRSHAAASNALPSIHASASPSSPSPPSPGIPQGEGEGEAQQSLSPARSPSYMRAAKKKAE